MKILKRTLSAFIPREICVQNLCANFVAIREKTAEHYCVQFGGTRKFPCFHVYFQSAQPQAHVERFVAEKLYAGCRGLTAENFAQVDKIQKFSCEIYNLPIFSLGCIKTGWGSPQIWYHFKPIYRR